MKNSKNINIKSKGIILSTFVLFSVLLIFIPTNVYGNEIDITNIGLEETTIITLKNNSDEDVNSLRIWLQEDFNFESFKTENGWVGEKNQAGVIIFTSSEMIKIGESVKFGIKTDKVNPVINWKVVNEKDEVIEKGVTNYIPLKSIFIRKYIQGSTSIPYSKEFSREPKEGEYLITGSKFFGWFGHISISPIEKIEKNFILPQTS